MKNKKKILKKSRRLKKSGSRLKTSGKKNKKSVKKRKIVKKAKKPLKTKALKKLTSAEKKADAFTRLSSELIEKGRKRGFITYDEILKTFPDVENNIFFLDELYEKFAIAGIDVLEGGNLLNLDNDNLDKDLFADHLGKWAKFINQMASNDAIARYGYFTTF